MILIIVFENKSQPSPLQRELQERSGPRLDQPVSDGNRRRLIQGSTRTSPGSQVYLCFRGMSNDSLVWFSDKQRVPHFERLAILSCN
jgi:hypothetical protein